MILASPDKFLYISITPEPAIHSPRSSSSSFCLSSSSAGMLPGKIRGRWRASLFDWSAAGSGRGHASTYISFVAGLF